MWHDSLGEKSEMGVLWQGDKIDPQSIVMILERERRAWLEAANGFDEMKPSLVSGSAVRKVTDHVHACRARAEALKRSVVRLCEQFNLPETFPEQHS
jgi:hypothetical protein